MTHFSKAMLPLGAADGSIPTRLAGTFRRWWLAYIDWRLQRLTLERLRSMSDRELKDIGLCRSQIEFAVRGAVERDPFNGSWS